MTICIGIRREDKNRFEKRVPLIPSHVKEIIEEHNITVALQPSTNRIFLDEDYVQVGATIQEDLSSCTIVLAIKEIPISFFQENKVYMFFSHTIKGQPDNMPLLKKLMELRCSLIDYEKIVDDNGQRLILFGQQAGQAGMIDTFWALGRRLSQEGLENPFSILRQAYMYSSLVEAKEAFQELGRIIQKKRLDSSLVPAVCGFAGYGSVSKGAQELFDILPHEEIAPEDIRKLFMNKTFMCNQLYKVVFEEKHLVEPVSSEISFNLQDYYDNPEKYKSKFDIYLPDLTLLSNCIYWAPKYPRLVTIPFLRNLWNSSSTPRLKVIGDISCDISGSIECTVHATSPDNPVFVYDPIEEKAIDGFRGRGVAVMAIDNLPAEISLESSISFSQSLKSLIPSLACADFSTDFEHCSLSPALKKAVILYKGELTPDFKYMEKYIQ
ncbi:MAG: bifunctional lysine ketoglutarate reductase /saccharopine dehydrogenase family protein [Candidatus Aminicenantes bacterium]|nr:bifunctional lysine ketoglutarate reductase /saccharopine dehydrogenase family protein [Candidatus Aminicenantes bacterium]